MRALLTAVLLFGVATASAQGGFYGTADGQITDPDGQPVVIKGVGLGGWLVPEGYMLDISAPDGGSPRSIRRQIVDLIGEDGADEFYSLYRANYVAEKDVSQIAEWGYDHVRLPFHYLDVWDPETETIRESGFDLFDEFLGWCRTYGLEVILDMHAAPGAQNSLNISDSDGTARLWTEPDPYQDWTVAIWTEIARRYAGETLIIGYDLINEPVLPDGIPASDLRGLYARLAEAVRVEDPNHILFIEGNYFATDFSALEVPVDDNMVYAFHKYWNAPNQGSIQYLLDLRQRTGVPLWLGETGENSNPWFYAARTLAETNGIGWNWWTHKKINTISAPASAPYAPGYQAVVDYWRGQGPRPTAAAAREALLGMAEGLDLDRTTTNRGVLAALFDDDFGTTARPFKAHTIPGAIAAVDYDLGNQGVAYSDSDPWAVSGTPGSGNNGGVYRNDGVDIERSADPQGYPYNVGWTAGLERLDYTVQVEAAGSYDVEIRVASGVSGGQFTLTLDGESLGAVTAPGTGGWQSWQSVYLRGVRLPAGEHVLRVVFRTGGLNLNTLRFTAAPATDAEDAPESGSLRLGVFPNPSSGATTVSFRTSEPTEASLVVFDTLGRQVFAGPVRAVGAGDQRIELDTELPAGVYVIQLALGSGASTTYARRTLTVR